MAFNCIKIDMISLGTRTARSQTSSKASACSRSARAFLAANSTVGLMGRFGI
jgi:hypothetical protein